MKVARALPFIGCGALLGIVAVVIVQTGGRALLVLFGLAIAFVLALVLIRARHRGLAVRRFRERYGPDGKDLLIVYTASPMRMPIARPPIFRISTARIPRTAPQPTSGSA